MILGYLVALALFGGVLPEHPVIVALCWLALWLLEKHGWRHWCGWVQHQRRGEQRNSGDDRQVLR